MCCDRPRKGRLLQTKCKILILYIAEVSQSTCCIYICMFSLVSMCCDRPRKGRLLQTKCKILILYIAEVSQSTYCIYIERETHTQM